MGLIAFVSAFGFASAAFAAAISSLVLGRQNFWRPRANIRQAMMAFFVFSIVGPYWLARNSLTCLRLERPMPGVALWCVIISLVWSFCAGVLVLELLRMISIV